eukprot:gene14883-20015_t
MILKCDVKVNPIINEKWWTCNVVYSKFRRQGIDIICASFVQPNNTSTSKNGGKANVIFITGMGESFIKYSETIQYLYERGFNVFTYDHQSQGLSGRWLAETQSVWVHSFEDYIDDFVYFVTTVSKEIPNLPVYLVAHSMGGLIGSMAMSRLPTLISRAILLAPMLRNKCGFKAIDYKYYIPQSVAYYIAQLMCYCGLGTKHTFGFFKEKPTDSLSLFVTTSDQDKLDQWRDLRMKYPSVIATCVTNDWIFQALKAQKKFASRYEFLRTNTLII